MNLNSLKYPRPAKGSILASESSRIHLMSEPLQLSRFWVKLDFRMSECTIMSLLTNSHRETSRPILARLGQGTVIFKKIERTYRLFKK